MMLLLLLLLSCLAASASLTYFSSSFPLSVFSSSLWHSLTLPSSCGAGPCDGGGWVGGGGGGCVPFRFLNAVEGDLSCRGRHARGLLLIRQLQTRVR